MKPILTVEFHAKDRGVEFEEENVTLHSPEELFEFVSPGGGCESIPNEVDEIRMVFMPLSLANCYSSRFGKLIEAAAVSLPTEFVQLDWQFGNDASYFSRRITAE